MKYDSYPLDSNNKFNCEYYLKLLVEKKIKILALVIEKEGTEKMYSVF